MAYMQSQEKWSPAVLEHNRATTIGLQREGSVGPAPVQLFPLPEERQLHRFYGSITINERLMGRDAAQVMDEVVKHLVSLNNAKVKVTIEVQAQIPNGVPTDVVRTVKENCKTLRFDAFGFEES